MRFFSIPLRRALPALALALPLLAGLPAPGHAENHKHHLGLALGYQKLLSNDFKDDALGIDYTNDGFGGVSYRLSILSNLDLSVDGRATTRTQTLGGQDLTLTSSFFGPGIRIASPSEGIRPFVQANLFLVEETFDTEVGNTRITASENGAGFGISGGVDIRASNLLSIPIEADFMYGKPSDDVSSLGVNVGLTFNFGQMSH
jgi:hypothetical protein